MRKPTTGGWAGAAAGTRAELGRPVVAVPVPPRRAADSVWPWPWPGTGEVWGEPELVREAVLEPPLPPPPLLLLPPLPVRRAVLAFALSGRGGGERCAV